MDNCDVIVASFPKLSKRKVLTILTSEGSQRPVTKSLLNLLYNIVIVGSLPVSRLQKTFLDHHSDLVLDLLSSSKSLAWKKAALEANVKLVLHIAASCPPSA